MVTALYDLATSPLTFDFAYAAVQAEVERRRRRDTGLTFHIRRGTDDAASAYGRGEREWRLRHLILPLSQMLPQAADLRVSEAPPMDENVFSRPYGLHWLSDVAIMAQAGEDVQLLSARASDKAALALELKPYAQGRRIISITLRETHYGRSRNSDLRSWAALSRLIPRDRYAVVVLRDHERTGEPLGDEWGDVRALPSAVWFLHQRAALYELAWLNLAVNNGPLGLLTLDRNTRFQIYKLDGGTWETSPQHFRRLGIEPGKSFPFLRAHQQMIWCDDHIFNLRRHVFRILEAMDSDILPDPDSAGDAIECLVDAARRDRCWGLPAADSIAHVPAGSRRGAVAAEWARLLLDEGRGVEAASALREAPRSAQNPDLTTALSELRSETSSASASFGTPFAGLLRRASERPGRYADRRTLSLAVRLPTGTSIERAMTLLGIAERERRQRQLDAIDLEVDTRDGHLLSAASLYPSIHSFACVGAPSPAWTPPAEATDAWAWGMASVPDRATHLLERWLKRHTLAEGYILVARGADERPAFRERADALGAARRLPLVDYRARAAVWPIEMLAALLARADTRVIGDPGARRIANVLGLAEADEPLGAPNVRSEAGDGRLNAENAYSRGLKTGNPEDAVALFGRAVVLRPETARYRLSFALALVRFNPNALATPAALRVLRRGGSFRALEDVLVRGGRAASAVEPFASGLVLAVAPVRRALDRAVFASRETLDNALDARPLRTGVGASIIGKLLCNVAVRDPTLLRCLDDIRHKLVDKMVAEPAYVPAATTFIGYLVRQVWIHDGLLVGALDPLLADRVMAAGESIASREIAHRLK